MNKSEALGLPPGSIRAVIALMFVAALIWAALALNSTEAKTALIALTAAAVNSYFNKPNNKGYKADETTT